MSQRRSAPEVRQLLLNAGLRILLRDGIRGNVSHVPMTQATAELERTHGIQVGMGSIFGKDRLWANVGEYNLDLLEAAIQDPDSGGPNDESLTLVHHLPDVTNEPYERRIEALVEVCRVAGNMNGYVSDDPAKGRPWRLWVSIWAIAVNNTEAGHHLKPALQLEQDRTSQSFVTIYEVLLSRLGLRPKPPNTLVDMATLAAAVTDGIALRSATNPDSVTYTKSHHSEAEWNLLGVGLTAIALDLLEDDVG